MELNLIRLHYLFNMKYFYSPHYSIQVFGLTHTCESSLYKSATLFKIKDKGICVVRKYYDNNTKSFWWGEIDDGLANDIFINANFYEYFKANATCMDAEGGYFTIDVRKLMWALRMKPLQKEYWEHICY